MKKKILLLMFILILLSVLISSCNDKAEIETTTAEYILNTMSKMEAEPTEITSEEATLSGRTHYCTPYEIWLIEQVVQVETGGSYWGSYYETATILNRLDLGWADSIEAVCFQEGQYPACQFGWLDNMISEETSAAVRDCIANNVTPIDLVYADSRHNYDISDGMVYYCSFDGQDFYLGR